MQDAGVDGSADAEHEGRRDVEADEGADAVGVFGGEFDHLPVLRQRHGPAGRWGQDRGEDGTGGGDDLPGLGLEDDGLGEGTQGGLFGQQVGEAVGAGVEGAGGAGQIGGHGERVGADVVAVLFQVAAADVEALEEGVADGFAQPLLDAKIEEPGGEDGDDDGGREGHAAEQQNEADMQARPRGAAAALDPHAGQVGGQHGGEEQQRYQIGQHQADDPIGREQVAGAGEDGGDAEQEGAGRDQQGRGAAHQQGGDAAETTAALDGIDLGGAHAGMSGWRTEVGVMAVRTGPG